MRHQLRLLGVLSDDDDVGDDDDVNAGAASKVTPNR
jgi:hypothetical protein